LGKVAEEEFLSESRHGKAGLDADIRRRRIVGIQFSSTAPFTLEKILF